MLPSPETHERCKAISRLTGERCITLLRYSNYGTCETHTQAQRRDPSPEEVMANYVAAKRPQTAAVA